MAVAELGILTARPLMKRIRRKQFWAYIVDIFDDVTAEYRVVLTEVVIGAANRLIDIDLVSVIGDIVGGQIGIKRLVWRGRVGQRNKFLQYGGGNRAQTSRWNDVPGKWRVCHGIVNSNPQRQQIREVAASFLCVRNQRGLGETFADSGAFVAAKKEGLVFADGPTHCTPKLVTPQLRLGATRQKVTAIEEMVSEELVCGAVIPVRPGLGDEVDLAARLRAELGTVVAGLYAELLNGIYR